MKAFRLFLLCCFIVTNQAYGQSHTLEISTGCRLAKPVKGSARNEGKSCPACVKENEQERTAKANEDKRRLEAERQRQAAIKAAEEKAYQEKLAKIEEEKRKKAAEEERLKQEAAAAKARLEAVQKNYAQKKGTSGPGELVVINELKEFFDAKNRTYGLKLNDSIVLKKDMPAGMMVWISRLSSTNYFVLTVFPLNESTWKYNFKNNVEQLMNMYGEIQKINGEENFLSITIKDNIISFKKADQTLTKCSEKGIDPFKTNHNTQIYESREELVSVHEKLVEAAEAAFRAKYANSGDGYIITNPDDYLYCGSGSYITTDISLKVTSTQTGYIYAYN